MQIDVLRCAGCGRCVASCPQHLLSLEVTGWKKHVVRQEVACRPGCTLCAAACPFQAITRGGETIATDTSSADHLPWASGTSPLMLAPMQGLTNRALRAFFAEWVQPDVLFTEFMPVKNVGERPLSRSDLREVTAHEHGIPLVVQLIGSQSESLVAAALTAQSAGARHLNLNLGCPYGRMTSGLTGGGLLRSPETIARLLPPLRAAVCGSFSVKIRAGYADPEQIFSLLPLFEEHRVDYLVLHPRTVVQEYSGSADHTITARVVQNTSLPVIANGDINTGAEGNRILKETGAAGLMLGRGAIADPLLFSRLRGAAPLEPEYAERGENYRFYLQEMVRRYGELFCGEVQLLGKVKNILQFMADPDYQRQIKKLRKTLDVRTFLSLINELGS